MMRVLLLRRKAMRKWTEKERKKQAAVARRHRPWKQSTGPQTAEGKIRASMNAMKTGDYSRIWVEYATLLRLNRDFMRQYVKLSRLGLNNLRRTNEVLHMSEKPEKSMR